MAIHWISSVVVPNAFWIVGIATLTMLVSRIDMNMPTMSTARGRPHPPDRAAAVPERARGRLHRSGWRGRRGGAARVGAVVTGRSSTDIT